MEKKVANVVIYGDLISNCKIKLLGGAKITHCKKDLVESSFDISSALIIHGNLWIDSFENNDFLIVVTGTIATKGGCHE